MSLMPNEHDGPLQCDGCGKTLRVLIKGNTTMTVTALRVALSIPPSLPSGLKRILSEAVKCFEAGSDIGAVILCRVFTEGLMTELGVRADRLADKINEAHQRNLISKRTFHAASASRLVGNTGAHYSAELETITSSEADLVLRLAFDMAENFTPTA